jgi:mono/diheme cytochrome c family protein
MSEGSTLKRLLFKSKHVLIFIVFLSTLPTLRTYGFAADSIPTDPSVISAGETLFKNNCAVCHAVDHQVVGPALQGVYNIKNLDWIYNFVHGSQKVIQGGDQYAMDLYKQFNNTVMPNFDFKNEEILSIVAYIKHETENPPQQATASSSAAPGQSGGAQGGIGKGYLIAILAGMVFILILILVVLLLLITTLTRYLKQKGGLDESENEILNQRIDLNKFIRSPGTIFAIAFIFFTLLLKAGIDGLYDIGVQQGYAPTQPIAFSHKIHAGQYAIPCQYCHTGVMKSKNANIPSPNICMNCHSQITTVTGQTEKSPEIQKIYDAIQNNKPIEWVRVHNLPDLSYFNHSQHYNVGGIECQTCHGPVETMDVIRQYNTLTMGWCIDCHRKTEIKSENPYYDKLVQLHSKESSKPMTVKDIGGMECNNCHY